MSEHRIRCTVFLRLRSSCHRDRTLRNREVGRNKRDVVIAICQRANRHCIAANIGTALASQSTGQCTTTYQRTSRYRIVKCWVSCAILLRCSCSRHRNRTLRNREVRRNKGDVVIAVGQCALVDCICVYIFTTFASKRTRQRVRADKRTRGNHAREQWVRYAVLL